MFTCAVQNSGVKRSSFRVFCDNFFSCFSFACVWHYKCFARHNSCVNFKQNKSKFQNVSTIRVGAHWSTTRCQKNGEKNCKMRFSNAIETGQNVRIHEFEMKMCIESLGKSDGLVCVPFDRRRRRQKLVWSQPNQRHHIAESLSIRKDTVLNALIANDFQTNRLFSSGFFEEKWLIRLFPSTRETDTMRRYSNSNL